MMKYATRVLFATVAMAAASSALACGEADLNCVDGDATMAQWELNAFTGTHTFGPPGTQVVNGSQQAVGLKFQTGPLAVDAMSVGQALYEGTLENAPVETGVHGNMVGQMKVISTDGICFLNCAAAQ